MSWVSPDGPILERSMSTDVPIAMVQMVIRVAIIAPWILSVKKEMRKPPRARID